MSLYVITDQQQLIGKTIAYAEIARYGNPHLLITTDGGLLLWNTENDGEGENFTEVYSQLMVERHMLSIQDRTLIKMLIKTGVFSQEDLDRFLAGQVEKRKQGRLLQEQMQEQRERNEFERLKKKFGDPHAGL